MRLFEKGQGTTDYLLMLTAVLIIVVIAVYYVTSIGGSPGVSASAEEYGDNEIRINVSSGSIPAGDWQYSVSENSGTYTWTDGVVELKAPYISLGTRPAGTYYVSLKHKPSGHVYISEQTITIS